MKFEDIKFDTLENLSGGEDKVARVEINGFDVSIVSREFSYGGKKGLYEMAIFSNGLMCDVLGWDDEVKGWLSPEDVEKELLELGKKSIDT
jgi:hypothetical protein